MTGQWKADRKWLGELGKDQEKKQAGIEAGVPCGMVRRRGTGIYYINVVCVCVCAHLLSVDGSWLVGGCMCVCLPRTVVCVLRTTE